MSSRVKESDLVWFYSAATIYEKVYLWHWQKVIATNGFIEENWQFPTSMAIQDGSFLGCAAIIWRFILWARKVRVQMCGQLWAIFVKERRASLVPPYLHPYPSQAAHCSGFRIRLLQLTFTYHIQWLTSKKVS